MKKTLRILTFLLTFLLIIGFAAQVMAVPVDPEDPNQPEEPTGPDGSEEPTESPNQPADQPPSTRPTTDNNPVEVRPVNLSNDTSLQFIKLSVGSLQPAFNSSIYEYEVEVAENTKSVTIEVLPNHSGARVLGDGRIDLGDGDNEIKIEVVAESGFAVAYTINFIEGLAQIERDDEKFGIVKNLDHLTLAGFEKKKIDLLDKRRTIFYNENISLIYLQDAKGEENFYIFNDYNNSIGRIMIPLVFKGVNYYPMPIAVGDQYREWMDFTRLSVQGQEIEGWIFHDPDLKHLDLLWLMNSQGDIGYYLYDNNTENIELYEDDLTLNNDEAEEIRLETINSKTKIIASIGLGIFVLISFALIYRKVKREIGR